ncbi:triose-phosphate isomerase [Sulfitobacter sp. D35]|uniref:triose-phosphate isomerase n=1 Tax=Sulfitobacter sp. D35 TaxID=3083252 RepID=UPI00296FEA26|nr:triose-phosphate isomerase [Sulfitobacter sp. D35]MDW4497381.1 triose-phosphate isomerase [Sulfitobacter sp. D35]
MTAPRYWIGTSWKMNKLRAEAELFTAALANSEVTRDPRIQRFVIPPFPLLREVRQRLGDTSVMVGAQNMHWADAGAWTGEVSPPMLVDCGMDIVELGHSERRAHFGETDETVGLKVEAAVRHGLVPLICIGESLAAREAGQARGVLEAQLRGAFARLSEDQTSAPILLAYEPVWAIGDGGVPATADYADERHAEIAAIAKELLGSRVPCLYGGSVNSQNCAELIRCPHVDGLFIGRAARDVEGYLEILSRCSAVI